MNPFTFTSEHYRVFSNRLYGRDAYGCWTPIRGGEIADDNTVWLCHWRLEEAADLQQIGMDPK